jgi:hypothetical protein
VVRGSSPGEHIRAATLRNRLRDLFSTRAARLGTVHELTKLTPVAILAETLGYHPTTIERHAAMAAATYARHITVRAAASEQTSSDAGASTGPSGRSRTSDQRM